MAGMAAQHYSQTQAKVALAELYALCSGTSETMGVLQFLQECEVKTGGCLAMLSDSVVRKPIVSRQGVRRATKDIQLHFLKFLTWWLQVWPGQQVGPTYQVLESLSLDRTRYLW